VATNNNEKIVIATGTFYLDDGGVRPRLALQTASEALRHGYIFAVIDGGSSEGFYRQMVTQDIIFLKEELHGMGRGRRQLLSYVANLVGDNGVIIWTEPEKWPLIAELRKATILIQDGTADLVIPGRTDEGLSSYPFAQACAERLGNSAFRALTGREFDMWFGCRVMNRRALDFFLNYQGEYGDLWEGMYIPVLRAIKENLRISSVSVNYIHPQEQSAEEEGTYSFIKKRLHQLNNLVPALEHEARKLGFLPTD